MPFRPSRLLRPWLSLAPLARPWARTAAGLEGVAAGRRGATVAGPGLAVVLLLGGGAVPLRAQEAATADSCEQFRARLAARIEAQGVRGHSIEIVRGNAALAPGAKVIGTCEGGARRIVYRRFASTSVAAADPAPAAPTPPAAAATPTPRAAPAPAPPAVPPKGPAPAAPPAPTPTAATATPMAPRAPTPAPAAAPAPAPAPSPARDPAPAAAPAPAPAPPTVLALSAPAVPATPAVDATPVDSKSQPSPPATAAQAAASAPSPPSPPASRATQSAASTPGAGARELLQRHGAWLWLALPFALAVLWWLWRAHFSPYDAAGLPRGPRIRA